MSASHVQSIRTPAAHLSRKSDVAVIALRQSHPEMQWATNSARLADFDCDGMPDTVVLGSEGNKVALGIVWKIGSKDAQVFSAHFEARLRMLLLNTSTH